MLIKPIISEKSLRESAKNKYTFKVGSGMNKTQIKEEVQKVFGVKVTKVQTITMPGKTYRSGRKWIIRRRANWKKAIVAIDGAKKIDLFEATAAQTQK